MHVTEILYGFGKNDKDPVRPQVTLLLLIFMLHA